MEWNREMDDVKWNYDSFYMILLCILYLENMAIFCIIFFIMLKNIFFVSFFFEHYDFLKSFLFLTHVSFGMDRGWRIIVM